MGIDLPDRRCEQIVGGRVAAPAITALSDERRAEIDESIELLTGNLAKIAEHGKRADKR
jgi:hypothetical protein